MQQRYLLDCTLRDGGYINDWKFGHDNLVNIFERLVSAGVDVIEIGFLDDRRAFDINRSIMPATNCVEKIFGKLHCKNSMIVGMIDYGTCDINNLQPCSESYLDGIRVIFKKDKMYPAMEYCRQIKDLGYKVFSQLVSIGSYSDEELLRVIRLANEVKPFALSMVDTYGLLNPQNLKHIMKIIDVNLDSDIILGFHAHNNFQLGYTNTISILEYKTNRDVVVDGTLYGMGKSAGNAPLELIALHMNEHYGKHYKITEMQEAITESVMDFQRKSPWGYQLFYYIAASNKVHPDYVSYLMNKRTLSVTSVNDILQRLPDDQKLEKNMKLIEELYINYQKNECDDRKDIEKLSCELKGKTLLVIGPGSSIGTYASDIQKFIAKEHPVIISINYIPLQFHPDYMFTTNSRRYVQSVSKLYDKNYTDIKLIVSSNLSKAKKEFDFVINYSNIIDETAEFPDNSMCMLIRTLIRCGCKDVVLAGLDGYTADSVNYYDVDKEYSFLKGKAASLNDYAKDFFESIADKIQVSFLTPSKYQTR